MTVHFQYEMEDLQPGTNRWRIACMPNMTEFGATIQRANYQMTNEVRAVTCEACKRTSAFKTWKDMLDAVIRSGAKPRATT
jgi:hypothetical protein